MYRVLVLVASFQLAPFLIGWRFITWLFVSLYWFVTATSSCRVGSIRRMYSLWHFLCFNDGHVHIHLFTVHQVKRISWNKFNFSLHGNLVNFVNKLVIVDFMCVDISTLPITDIINSVHLCWCLRFTYGFSYSYSRKFVPFIWLYFAFHFINNWRLF